MDRARCNGCATHGDSRFTAFPPRQCELTFGTWPHGTTKSEARFASRCRDAGDELPKLGGFRTERVTRLLSTGALVGPRFPTSA